MNFEELKALVAERELIGKVGARLVNGGEFTIWLVDPKLPGRYLVIPESYGRDAICTQIANRAEELDAIFARLNIEDDDDREPESDPAPVMPKPSPTSGAGEAKAPNVEATLLEDEDAHNAGHGAL